jgi:hypothetical protein
MTNNEAVGRPDRLLWAAAVEGSIEKLTQMLRSMRPCDSDLQSEDEKLVAVLHQNDLVETAAWGRKEPSEVAELAVELEMHRQHDLAALTLETASALREPQDLATLVTRVGQGSKRMLRAVIRRRMPRDIASVLRELHAASQPDLIEQALAVMAEDCVSRGDVLDAVSVTLLLRGRQCNELTRLLCKRMVVELPAQDLAAFILRLRSYEDHASAHYTTATAISELEVGQVADLIACLQEGDVGYANSAVDTAVDQLAQADSVVLASLLEKSVPDIRGKIGPGLDDDEKFWGTLRELERRSKAEALHTAFRMVAETHSVERIYDLVRWINGKMMDSGVDTILSTVAQRRPVEEVVQLADRLRRQLYIPPSERLLEFAFEHAHERTDGRQAATLISLRLDRLEELRRNHLLSRSDQNGWNDIILRTIRKVIGEHNPPQLMSFIHGLITCHRYSQFSELIEKEVARSYSAADLAKLPSVCGTENPLVVLDLMMEAVKDQNKIKPSDIVAFVGALRKANVREDQLSRLLQYIGFRRHLDYDLIVNSFKKANLESDAAAVQSGRLNPSIRKARTVTRRFLP